MKKVLISGFLGQDGANMAEYLLANTEHLVYGMIRRSANPNFTNVQNLLTNPRVKIVYADLTDSISMDRLIQEIKPDYFINLGANSFVGCSWDMPVQVFETNALGVLYGLEAIRKHCPACRYYSAGSSEEFGNVDYSPQDIKHPMKPRSPYGASKAAARMLVKVYRESYNIYAVHGLLFNHEGTRRGEEFVTRKITKGVARIVKAISEGKEFEPIELGNLDAKRDWSDSEDFVEGIWRMLNQELYNSDFKAVEAGALLSKPIEYYLAPKLKEYVLSSGETHTVREFVNLAFKEAGVKGFWSTPAKRPFQGYEEFFENIYNPEVHGPCGTSLHGKLLVKVNQKFYRPADVELLIGDSNPIRKELGWVPKTTFPELVKKMVRHDIYLA
jgi:GDPmannose 4,6-dehydratase